jgi:hypothetical protein
MTYKELKQPDQALDVLKRCSTEMLADLNRWPDLAELLNEPRFSELLAWRGIKR